MSVFGNQQYNSGGRGSAIKMRLVIMAVLAIGSVIGYVMKFQTNPMTGKMQALDMNPDQEIAMGLQSAPEMAREMGGEVDARVSEEARHVKEIGQQLVKATPKAFQSPYAQHFDFHLLADTQTVNAFALPGGQVFITKALYDRLETDGQLAGVLGHEIGHVLYRHASEHMAKSKLGQGLVGAVATGSGDQTTAQIAATVNQMIQLKYGREDESQSDSWGLENMVAAGYDPRQMIRVMEILMEVSGTRGGSALFASHPNPEKRIVDIKSYIENVWHNKPPTDNPGKPIVRGGGQQQNGNRWQ